MAKKRIPTKPTELRDQMLIASAGIAGEPNWPATGPTQAVVDAHVVALTNNITAVANAEAALTQVRAALRAERDAAYATMKRVDEITDGLYQADGVQKTNFGLDPKKTTPGASVPLEKVVITKIGDGISPGSVFVDWDSQEGAAAYQVEWFFSSNMLGQPIGNAAVSESEYEITGLSPQQQVWMRVRAVRGSEFGPWSDPATRVANV